MLVSFLLQLLVMETHRRVLEISFDSFAFSVLHQFVKFIGLQALSLAFKLFAL